MKLFSSALNIDKKKVINKKVFDKVILIVSFIVCNKKALNLESGNLADSVTVLVFALNLYNIFRNTVIINLEILITENKLAVSL